MDQAHQRPFVNSNSEQFRPTNFQTNQNQYRGRQPNYDDIDQQQAMFDSQDMHRRQAMNRAAMQQQQTANRSSPNSIGQQNKLNQQSPKKSQQTMQTASTRYMYSSSQNYADNDGPRIEQARMLDTEDDQTHMAAADFLNINSQYDDNGSMNDQEGGAIDNQDAPHGYEMQTKQYIPHNMRMEAQRRDEIDPKMPSDDHRDFAMPSSDAQTYPNFNPRHQAPSPVNMTGTAQQLNNLDDEDNTNNNIQSHDQITVEIEMIDQSLKKRPNSNLSNDSPTGKNIDPSMMNNNGALPTQQNQQSNGGPLSLKVPDMLQQNQRPIKGQSLTERVGMTEDDDQQSINDRQDDGTNDDQSNGKIHSDKISNKNESDSSADEDDDENDTASLDSIDKLQNILNEINDQTIEHLKNEETDQALENLKRAEQILEDYTNEGKDVDRNMIIIVLYNQACCYQRLSMLDDCSNYLDGTIFNLQQKLLNFEEQEQEIRDMILEAEQNAYPTDRSKAKKKIMKHAYGYDDEDDEDYIDNMGDSNPYEMRNQDQYGLQMAKNQTQKKQSYNLSSLSIHNKGQFDDGLSAGGAQLSEQSQDFQNLNDVQEPPEHYDLSDPDALAQIEASKKLSISQKLFKLRYLCKCHLQLCAVQSQLNKHKDALHHGQMASVYCQELIRNSKTLCEGYIGEILGRKTNKEQVSKQDNKEQASKMPNGDDDEDKDSKSSDKDLGNKLKEHYYLEDDQKLLDVLIKNCHPILTDMLKQINNFNQYNELNENSKKALMREQDILKGLRMEIANTEFDQDLMQLIESKESFAINLETKQNIERFRVYEAELRKKGYKSDQQLNQSSLRGDIFGQLEQDEKQINRKNSRKSIGKKQNNKQFVDEMAPNQAQFDLNRSQHSKAKEVEEHEVYFKNEDAMNSSFNSVGTYGQNNHNFQSGGIGPQGYLNLRNNVKTVLVTQEEDDWIFNLNIGNVMHLQPLSSEQMNLHMDNSHELSRDAMLEKIILLTVSYFCVGTELRFLNNNSNSADDKIDPLNKSQKDKMVEQERERKKKKELSEMWHAQALEASARFLPSECPLVAHVITNYQKHHSPALTIIPEDEELQEDLRVVRPLNEVKNDNINYYQIIRNHLKFERSTTSQQNHFQDNGKQKGRNGINNQLTTISETPEPILVNPKAIQEPQKQNFMEPDSQQRSDQKDQQAINPQKQQNILVNDFQIEQNKDMEPFSPDTFDGEEFGKDLLLNNQQKLENEQMNFFPDQDQNANENGAVSSDDAGDMIQFADQRDQFENFNTIQGEQLSASKMSAVKSMNQLKTRKIPKSPGTLAQSLSGTFHNTQQFKIPSGMQFLQNKQDTQRSQGKIKIKKQVADSGKSAKKDSLANRNQNTHVNSTGLTRIGSIKQRLKMMPSNKSTKVIKQGIPKKPMNVGQTSQPIKKLTDYGKSNQSSSQLQKKKTNFQNMKIPSSQMNTFSSTSKLLTMKSISPSTSNQVSANPSFYQAQLQNNNPNAKKNIQSSKHLKHMVNSNQKAKPPTQNSGQNRKPSSGQNNQMSIAQNIQKITQVLSQKISSMSQSLGNSSRQNSKARQEETPLQETSQQQMQYSKGKERPNRKSSEHKTHEISSDDDAEANIDGELANDISAERPGNGPAQKIKLLHNVPKVSGSNLMIKTKASMQFPNQKAFMTLQNKNLNSQLRTGSGTRIQGSQMRPSIPGQSTNPSILNSNQKQKLQIKVLGQKKNTLQVQDPSSLKINSNMSNKAQTSMMSQQQMHRTPQHQQAGSTRLMPSSVNNFSMQNNMYHRALLQQQQQQQQQQYQSNQQLSQQQHQSQNNWQMSPAGNRQSNQMVNSGINQNFGQVRKSTASNGSGSGKLDPEKLQSNKILIAQQNIKNIQSSLVQRGNNSGRGATLQNSQGRQHNQQMRAEMAEQMRSEDRGAMSPSAQSNGLNNTNCNVTASLNNISGLSNVLLSGPTTAQGIQNPQQLLAQQKSQMQHQLQQQQQQQILLQDQQQSAQQINRLPISTQKFRQPMRIMKFKK